MNTPLLLLAFLFCGLTAVAQIPSGYYNNAYVNPGTAKTCAELKTALFGIISADTNVLFYNSPDGSFDTQDAVNKLDIHRNDDNTADIIWDMYTDNPSGIELYSFTPAANQCGGSFPPEIGACYNREHAFPLNWVNNEYPMRSDVHHIFATDGETNSRHANWPYAEVGAVQWQSPAGAKVGACSFPGYTGTAFEPIDEYKGDFARAMFYMVTDYEELAATWQSNGNADSILNGTTWPSLDDWAIRQWYKWHIQDPVSQKEINRNDSIYIFQHNRNPYIDHPEFVELVWRCTGLLPVTIINFNAVNNNFAVNLHWTVGEEINVKQYEIERSVNGISFNKIGIMKSQRQPGYYFVDNNLPDAGMAFYRLKIVDIDGKISYSKTVTIKLNKRSELLNIYPNPATFQVTIKSQIKKGSRIRITDMTGKEMMEMEVKSEQTIFSFPTDHLATGRYFISIAGNDDTLHGSFIIIR